MTLQPPGDDVKRPYRSPRRAAQAAGTRKAILDAAAGLFESQGFQDTTMKLVAEQASVSEQTVYNIFSDKIGLLCAVAEDIASSEDGGESEVLDRLAAEPDPQERIALAARFSREQWQAGAVELDRMLFSPELRDPRLLALSREVLEYKLEMSRAFCELLFPAEIRRPDLQVEDIATFFAAVDSGATIAALRELGWTDEQYERWLIDLFGSFLDPSKAG